MRVPLMLSLFGVLLAGLAHAQSKSPEGGALTKCYLSKAAAYGLSSCDPPGSLVQAVFRGCAKEEKAAGREASAEAGVDVADPFIAALRELIRDAIENAIVEARQQSGSCENSN